MSLFISGTDTDVGKTVVAAWLKLHLKAKNWKPIQCGFEPSTDAETIKQLTKCPAEDILPTTYNLSEPLSPHEAALRAGVTIELEKIQCPNTGGPVIVEGAGGLLVPLNKTSYIIDLIAQLDMPIILVCRSTLGTLNHSLLSIEAIRQRGLSLAGLVLVGPDMPHNRTALEFYGSVPILGELPILQSLNEETLLEIKPYQALYDSLHQSS